MNFDEERDQRIKGFKEGFEAGFKAGMQKCMEDRQVRGAAGTTITFAAQQRILTKFMADKIRVQLRGLESIYTQSTSVQAAWYSIVSDCSATLLNIIRDVLQSNGLTLSKVGSQASGLLKAVDETEDDLQCDPAVEDALTMLAQRYGTEYFAEQLRKYQNPYR